ncbi:phage virion morphogenesis protein [Paralysiella testudinis]|uniref:phage virion morphogenesis protein n=1 Tax=Paralysiella testudinis TaxID=2809020 RepID=UPI002E232CE0
MFEISLDEKDLKRGLGQLLKNATDNRPMMRGIATELIALTEDNFEDESWGGDTWKKSQRAADEGGKTLQRDGGLAGNISTKVGNSFARIGSNKPYAAIHHLGGQTKAHKIRPKKKKGWPSAALCVNPSTTPAATSPHAPTYPSEAMANSSTAPKKPSSTSPSNP